MAEREEDIGDLSGPGAGKAARGGPARRLLRRGEREARTDRMALRAADERAVSRQQP